MTINASQRRGCLLAAALLIPVVAIAGAAWDFGLFASRGRFIQGLDACTLLPPPQVLAPLVPKGAREPGDSRPKTFIGIGDGDRTSQCKWSSVPTGQDRPFRTVRIHTETTVKDGHSSAEAEARRALALSYRNARGKATRIDLGEEGYRTIDTMVIQIVFSRTTIYDLHAKFRISNALIDVSARTHSPPTDEDTALVMALAKNIAGRLGN